MFKVSSWACLHTLTVYVFHHHVLLHAILLKLLTTQSNYSRYTGQSKGTYGQEKQCVTSKSFPVPLSATRPFTPPRKVRHEVFGPDRRRVWKNRLEPVCLINQCQVQFFTCLPALVNLSACEQRDLAVLPFSSFSAKNESENDLLRAGGSTAVSVWTHRRTDRQSKLCGSDTVHRVLFLPRPRVLAKPKRVCFYCGKDEVKCVCGGGCDGTGIPPSPDSLTSIHTKRMPRPSYLPYFSPERRHLTLHGHFMLSSVQLSRALRVSTQNVKKGANKKVSAF